MQVTALGLVVLPVGMLLFLIGSRPLGWATVASLPFFSTVIIHLGFAPVRPFHYLALLCAVRQAADVLSGRRQPWSLSRKAAIGLGLFVFSICISFAGLPALVGKVYVVSESTRYIDYSRTSPLEFSRSNLTQCLYPLFGILLMLVIRATLVSVNDLKRAININVIIAGLVGVYTVAYQAAHHLSYEPIFDTLFGLVHGAYRPLFEGYGRIGPVLRTHTFVGEPGYTSLFLLFILSYLLAMRYSGYSQGWYPRSSGLWVVIVSTLLLVSGSTTAYLGLVILILALPLVGLLRGTRPLAVAHTVVFGRAVLLFLSVVICGFVAVSVFTGIEVLEFIRSTQLQKIAGEAGSGAIRLLTVRYSLEEVFLASPIVGVGFGSHRSLSLGVALLANVGIIGFLAFLVMNGIFFTRALQVAKYSTRGDLASIAFGAAVALASMLPVMLIAKELVAILFGWYWLLFAMIESAHRLYRDEHQVLRLNQSR